MDGARPLIDRQGRNDLEVAIAEIVDGKIAPAYHEEEPVETSLD